MLDPNIALSVRPAAAPDPLEALARMQSIKSQAQMGQLRDLEIHQQQELMADDHTTRQVMAANNGDLNAALPQLAGKISPKAWIGLQNTWLETQKNKFGLLKSQNDVADQFHETLGKLALGVKAAGNTPQAFGSAVDSLTKLNPQVAPHLAPYVDRAQQDPAAIGQMMDGLIAGTAAGAKERQVVASEKTADARERQADTADVREAREGVNQQATRVETNRHNLATEDQGVNNSAETARHNVVTEQHGVLSSSEIARHNRVSERQGQERINNAEANDGDGNNGQTPNSRAVDQRKSQDQISKMQQSEGTLNSFRGKLGTAISSGNTYVDRLGNVVPMDKAAGGDKSVAQSLTADMRQRYSEITDQLKKAISSKNDLITKLGGTLRVSTAQAHAAIDAGDAKLLGTRSAGAAKPKLSGTRFRVQLQDGRTGTVDAAEYDPNTMKKF